MLQSYVQNAQAKSFMGQILKDNMYFYHVTRSCARIAEIKLPDAVYISARQNQQRRGEQIIKRSWPPLISQAGKRLREKSCHDVSAPLDAPRLAPQCEN